MHGLQQENDLCNILVRELHLVCSRAHQQAAGVPLQPDLYNCNTNTLSSPQPGQNDATSLLDFRTLADF